MSKSGLNIINFVAPSGTTVIPSYLDLAPDLQLNDLTAATCYRALTAMQSYDTSGKIILTVEGCDWFIASHAENFLADSDFSYSRYAVKKPKGLKLVRQKTSISESSIKELYCSSNWLGVFSYLESNIDLVDLLLNFPPKVLDYLGGSATFHLGYFSDRTQDYECLYITVENSIEDEAELEVVEDRIFLEVFHPVFDLYRGRIIFSLV